MINSHLQAETSLAQRREHQREQNGWSLNKALLQGTNQTKDVLICDDMRRELRFFSRNDNIRSEAPGSREKTF